MTQKGDLSEVEEGSIRKSQKSFYLQLEDLLKLITVGQRPTLRLSPEEPW